MHSDDDSENGPDCGKGKDSDGVLVEWCVLVLTGCTLLAEKSQAFSPHSEAKKQALGPDDLRNSNLGRPVLSPYPMSPRDMAKISQDLVHFNCESSSVLSSFYIFLTVTSAKNQIFKSHSHNFSCFSAFQQAGHPLIPSLSQDSGRLAAVRPLMPEPPPLISSTKPGGSITQVFYHTRENRGFYLVIMNLQKS